MTRIKDQIGRIALVTRAIRGPGIESCHQLDQIVQVCGLAKKRTE